MSYIKSDRVKEFSTIIGTGTIPLLGAAVGFRTFASQMSVGDTCSYVISNVSGSEWESGIATYSAANTLTRTTVQSSTNANAVVNFSAGMKDVFIGPTANTVLDRNQGNFELKGSPAGFAYDDIYINTFNGIDQFGSSLHIIGGNTITSAENPTQLPARDLVLAGGYSYSFNPTHSSEDLNGSIILAGWGLNNILEWNPNYQYGDPSGWIDYQGNLCLNPDLNLRFYNYDKTHYVGLMGPLNPTTDTTWTLPSADGSASQPLITNGSGTLSWGSITGTGNYVLATSPTLVTPKTNSLSAVPVGSGAGNSLTLAAGSGVGTGAGGSLVLQAGIQATSGGDGKVVVKQVAGQTSNLQEWQDSSATIKAFVDSSGNIATGLNAYSNRLYIGPSVTSYLTGGSQSTGLLMNGNAQLSIYAGVTEATRFFANSILIRSDHTISWCSNIAAGSINATITSDGAATLAQRNGTNPQTFRVYNTYTSASVYERASLSWASNVCTLTTESTTAGAGRNLVIAAGNGVTTGAGGNLILQAGIQATSGNDGKVIVKQVSGQTSNLQEWQDSAGAVLAAVSAAGVFSTPQLTLTAVNNVNTSLKLNSASLNYGWYSGDYFGINYGEMVLGSINMGNNTVAIRNFSSAQIFRIYNTFTDASNYERLGITWASNICTIGLAQAGTGLPRTLNVNANAVNAPALPVAATVTAATGNGTTVTYTCASTFAIGQVVSITGLTITTGSSLNLSNQTITGVTTTAFTVTNATVGTAAATQAGTATIQSAGNSLTLTAGNGSGVGKGGDIVLAPGVQGTSGGNGAVVISSGTLLKFTTAEYLTGSSGFLGTYIGSTTVFGCSRYSGFSQATVAGALSFVAHGSSLGQNSYVTTSVIEYAQLGVLQVFSGRFNSYSTGCSFAFPSYTQTIGTSLTITNKSLTGNVATLTTSVPHKLSYGQAITISGVDATFDGTYTVTFPYVLNSSLTTFSYAKTAADVTSQAATGTATIVLNDMMLQPSAFVRLNVTTAQTITGIAPPIGYNAQTQVHVDGRMIRIYNVGTANLTLAHISASSTTGNKFFNSTGADIILAPNDYAELIWDGTNNGSGSSGWRVA